MKKVLKSSRMVLTGIVLLISAFANSQVNNGEIRGKILEEGTDMGLPGVNVWVEVAGEKVGSATDAEGRFLIKPLNPGKYELNATFMGYKSIKMLLEVVPDKATYVQNLYMKEDAELLSDVEVLIYEIPLIDPGNGSVTTMTYKELEKRPDIRNINAMVGTVGGVYTSASGDSYVRGSRSDASIYFVDGVKVPGGGTNINIPGVAIGSITVYTGGVPAKYGDVTSGVIIIETKSYFDMLRAYNSK